MIITLSLRQRVRAVGTWFITLLSIICVSMGRGTAATASTAVTQVLSPGLLVLAAQPTITMNGATLSLAGAQTSAGSMGLMTVTDSRGSGAGWSLTATTTPFTKVGVPVQTVGSIGSLTTLGQYTGATGGTYTITIVTGGALGTSTYSVSGLETQAATATSAVGTIGTRGLTAVFGAATYVTGEQWTISVDTIGANNLTITPSAATAVVGSTTGVSSGSAYTYTTGSDPATIMTATASNGLGQYTDTPALSLNIPAGTKAGSYVATITETLN